MCCTPELKVLFDPNNAITAPPPIAASTPSAASTPPSTISTTRLATAPPLSASSNANKQQRSRPEVPDYATLLRDHVTLTCRSVDRIFLQGYVPKLKTVGGVCQFLR